MAIDIVKFIKGLIVTNETDFDKHLQLKVTDSATTNTTTTLQSSQTADRTITLPDSSGILITTGDEISRANIAPGTPNRVVINDGSGDLADSTVTSTELDNLLGTTSNIQTQLNNKQDSSSAVTLDGVQTLTNKTIGDAITLTEIVTPSNPAAGLKKLYPKADGKLYTLNSAGTETEVGSGSGGGANQTLSNLTSPTAINQDLLPATNASADLGSSATAFGSVFAEDLNLKSAGSTGIVKLTAPAASVKNATFVIPDEDGTVGQFMITDGAGNLGFADINIDPTTNAKYFIVSKSVVSSVTDEYLTLSTYFENTITSSTAGGYTTVTLADPGQYMISGTIPGTGSTPFSAELIITPSIGVPPPPQLAGNSYASSASSQECPVLYFLDVTSVPTTVVVAARNSVSASRTFGGGGISQLNIVKVGNSVSVGGAVDSVNGQTGVVQIDAADVPYDNTASGLVATNVQTAIDEVAGGSPSFQQSLLNSQISPVAITNAVIDSNVHPSGVFEYRIERIITGGDFDSSALRPTVATFEDSLTSNATFYNGKFILPVRKVTGAPSTGGGVFSSTDGATWTLITYTASGLIGVQYATVTDSALILSASGLKMLVSTDGGNSFIGKDIPAGVGGGHFSYGAGYLVGIFTSVGPVGDVAVSSDNGTSWSTYSLSQRYLGNCYGNGRFLLTNFPGGMGTNKVAYTTGNPNGAWTETTVTMPVAVPNGVLVFGNGVFMVPATGGVVTSPDGITWTFQSIPSLGGAAFNNLTFTNGKFTAVYTLTKTVYTSADGITWTSNIVTDLDNTISPCSIVHGLGFYLMCQPKFNTPPRIVVTTTIPERIETGSFTLSYSPSQVAWNTGLQQSFGGVDTGVNITVDSTGQLFYTSTDEAQVSSRINYTLRKI